MLKAALAGAIGGMFGAGFDPVRIIAGRAVGALVTGGDPLMGAMTAGISAGVGACFAKTPLPGVLGRAVKGIGNAHLRNLMFSAASGALCGGVTAEIFGGDFASGAAFGAAGAAAGFVISNALDDLHFGLMAGKVYGEPEYLTVRRIDSSTGESYSYTVKLNEVEDFVYEILRSNIPGGDKIEYMRFDGHGTGMDSESMRGVGLIMRNEVLFEKADGNSSEMYGINRLIKTGALTKAFTPNATIELRACWSAYRRTGGLSIADRFKQAVPHGKVYGYTTDAFLCGIRSHNWYLTGKWKEVQLYTKPKR